MTNGPGSGSVVPLQLLPVLVLFLVVGRLEASAILGTSVTLTAPRWRGSIKTNTSRRVFGTSALRGHRRMMCGVCNMVKSPNLLVGLR